MGTTGEMAIRDAVDVVVGISRRSVRDVMDVDISAELWSMTLSIYTGALGPSVVLIGVFDMLQGRSQDPRSCCQARYLSQC